jgi:NADH-quinone oxidoreductase subunit J
VSPVLFFPLATLLVLAACGVVASRNPIRSAMWLVAALFLLAVFFAFLDAHLVAALQVIVYTGAIMVLFLFVIMLLNLETEPDHPRSRSRFVAGAVGGLAFAGALLGALGRGGGEVPGPGMAAVAPAAYGTTAALGDRLFTHYVLPFEITSVLLLVAVIGAVVVAKRKHD